MALDPLTSSILLNVVGCFTCERKDGRSLSDVRLIDFFSTPPFRINLPPYILYACFREISIDTKSSMASSRTPISKISESKRTSCCGLSHHNAAIVGAFLTLANGIVTLVTGMEGLLHGSVLVYDRYVVQTTIGSTIVFLALVL